MGVAKYVAFAAFIVFSGSGIALGYTGGSVLTAYVAYLSPWLPSWIWVSVSSVFVLGVAITAVSVAGAIASIAPNRKAFRVCLILLLTMVVSELAGTGFVYLYHERMGQDLCGSMADSMRTSAMDYGMNDSDTQMWDEIQKEMNCCGVDNYKDWFATDYGKGSSVPDSCCLDIEPGCGANIISSNDPESEVITVGCLPTVLRAIRMDYHILNQDVWLPVCGLHGILILVIVASSLFMREAQSPRQLPIYSVTSLVPIVGLHKYHALNNHSP